MSTACGQPDPRAEFESLVRASADMLEAYLRTLVRSPSALDDVFQESLLVAWRKFDLFDRARPFGPWLRGIAQLCVLESARKARARAITTDPQILAEIDLRFDELATDSSGSTFLDRVDRLTSCLDRLPDAMRQAIELVYAREVTIVAAARSLELSEETLKKRVQRGRRMLAECLGLHQDLAHKGAV